MLVFTFVKRRSSRVPCLARQGHPADGASGDGTAARFFAGSEGRFRGVDKPRSERPRPCGRHGLLSGATTKLLNYEQQY